MEDLKLAIEGMHCGGCVSRVTAALNKVEGVQVQKVEVGSAEVAYDPARTSPSEISAAVEEIGFSAAKAL